MSLSEDDLRSALAPLAGDADADARRVLAALPARLRRTSWKAWAPALAVGLVAGFLLALVPVLLGVIPFRGEPLRGPFLLAAATGQVFVHRGDRGEVELLATGASFHPRDRLQTDHDACASVKLPDGSEVRLNAATSVVFGRATGREVRLDAGEVWTRVVPGRERFRVAAGAGSVVAEGTVLDIVAGEDFLSVVTIAGAAVLRDQRGAERRIDQGYRAEIRGGAVGDPVSVGAGLWQVTDWTVELMRYSGDHEEIGARVTQLLALIGRTKFEHLAEMEIRQLGTHCVLPMTRFIQGADPDGEKGRRRYAAQLVADLADFGHARELFELLLDPDPLVRVAAYRGLARLSGPLRAGDEAFWTDAPVSERAAAAARWERSLEREPSGKR